MRERVEKRRKLSPGVLQDLEVSCKRGSPRDEEGTAHECHSSEEGICMELATELAGRLRACGTLENN